jgi:hypothetical protein
VGILSALPDRHPKPIGLGDFDIFLVAPTSSSSCHSLSHSSTSFSRTSTMSSSTRRISPQLSPRSSHPPLTTHPTSRTSSTLVSSPISSHAPQSKSSQHLRPPRKVPPRHPRIPLRPQHNHQAPPRQQNPLHPHPRYNAEPCPLRRDMRGAQSRRRP